MYCSNNSIGRLTFCFPYAMRSPPEFTYDKEPDQSSVQLSNIKKIAFGINAKNKEFYFMNGLKVQDREDKEVINVAAGIIPSTRFLEIELGPNE